MNGPTMGIGEAARRTQLSVDAIRFYERCALMPPPYRSPARYRQFTAADVERLRFIRRAQVLGFSLREIRQLSELLTGAAGNCAQVRDLLRIKVADVRRRRRHLQSLEAALSRALARCQRELRRHDPPTTECPVLRQLSPEEDQ